MHNIQHLSVAEIIIISRNLLIYMSDDRKLQRQIDEGAVVHTPHGHPSTHTQQVVNAHLKHHGKAV